MTNDAHEQLQRLRIRMGFLSRNEARIERIGDRYEVIKELAEGGMGKVFLVRDTRFEASEALVALKLVQSNNAALQDRLWREAHALLSLRKSRHVVPVYDVGKRGEDTYFTMRHVEGGTLRAWQAGKSLPEILDAYLAAAEGLCDAHERGIVHRDFKADNVLVEGKEVLVADFGLAASSVLVPDDQVSTFDGTTPSKPGITVGGTLPYMAPEQFAGEPADAKTDQFSFCVALWEASAGCLPWQWHKGAEQADAMRQRPQTECEIPGWLRQALLRGMAFDRKDRFPDMRTLVRRLARGRGRRARVTKTVLAVSCFAAALAMGALIMFEPLETCDEFVATIDAHWPRGVELDSRSRARLDELAQGWRDVARTRCGGELAPSLADRERRCMESWLGEFDVVIEMSSDSGWSPELLESLSPMPTGYCDMQRIDLDPLVRDKLMRARVTSLAGQVELADQHLELAAQQAELLASRKTRSTLELAEVDVARVELLARSGRHAAAREAFEWADASTVGYREPRADLLLFWAKFLALYGGHEDLQRANDLYYEGKGLLGETAGLRGAELVETAGQVERAAGNFNAAAEALLSAADQFEALGRPLRAARARQNAGAALHERGDLVSAELRYREALDVMTRLDLPRSPIALHARYELANLLGERVFARVDPLDAGVACQAALEQLEKVVEHAEPTLRVDALGLALRIIGQTGELDEFERWRVRADRELAQASGLDPELRARVEIEVALAMLYATDPRGESRVLELLDAPAIQHSASFESLRTSWTDWLAEHSRCDELRATLVRFSTIPDPSLVNCNDTNPEPTQP